MYGTFPVYKPKGVTSNDIVDKVRRMTGKKRVGHGGTLDPFASGVLVIGVGRENTKKLQAILKNSEKVYRAKIRFGAKSSTDDPEGEIIEVPLPYIPEIGNIRNVLKQFEGKIKQVPPSFSAINIKGKKAYQLARKGVSFVLKPRSVFIREIKLLSYQWPHLELEITCGSGVYIRSLARDIGDTLGVGGYVKELERTRVGEYILEHAIRLPL